MRKLLLLFPALLLVVFLTVLDGFEFAKAGTDPSCSGNICSATVSVGGSDVTYSYTLNHKDSGTALKIRFESDGHNGEVDPVRFSVTTSQAFDSVTSLKNPSPTKLIPPLQNSNLTNTQVERLEPREDRLLRILTKAMDHGAAIKGKDSKKGRRR